MLVLSRRKEERIIICDDIIVTILDIKGNKVRLGIQAPAEVSVHRQEVYEAINAQTDSTVAAQQADFPHALQQVTTG
ncbi:MAG: carbon storage regulator CsrA [Pirellulales bacterium]